MLIVHCRLMIIQIRFIVRAFLRVRLLSKNIFKFTILHFRDTYMHAQARTHARTHT